MFKNILFKTISKYFSFSVKRATSKPLISQHKCMKYLVKEARNTVFGQEHHFSKIHSYEEFKKHIPLRTYEDFLPYIERIKAGENHILWKDKPLYFAKTSGTTSGAKYIPISKDSIHNHINSARNSLMCYVDQSEQTEVFDGKMIFVQGTPELEELNGIKVGRLSGIVAHHIPTYVQHNRMPSWKTNCIADWEEKIDKIAEETLKENMTVISGIPPWLQHYFEVLLQKSGKKNISSVFPKLRLIVTGGVNYEPYRMGFERLLGNSKIPVIQTYPSSEGFIAYQNDYTDSGMLLVIDEGIFYEFIALEDFYKENPNRIDLSKVECNKDYVLVLNTNAGLWGYVIGDTVRFIALNPYKLIVSGRIKQYISAFGEHVIAYEVEQVMEQTLAKYHAEIVDFTVAPFIADNQGESRHEWYVEFNILPTDLNQFAKALDQALCEQNTYYADLRAGNMLQNLHLKIIPQNGFNTYMKSIGKLGGQNKLVRLSNDRKLVEAILKALDLEAVVKNTPL